MQTHRARDLLSRQGALRTIRANIWKMIQLVKGHGPAFELPESHWSDDGLEHEVRSEPQQVGS